MRYRFLKEDRGGGRLRMQTIPRRVAKPHSRNHGPLPISPFCQLPIKPHTDTPRKITAFAQYPSSLTLTARQLPNIPLQAGRDFAGGDWPFSGQDFSNRPGEEASQQGLWGGGKKGPFTEGHLHPWELPSPGFVPWP